MDAESFRAWILFGLALFASIGGGLMFVLKLILAPIKSYTKDLAESVKLIRHMVQDVDTKVVCHENRLIRIENTHEIRGCNVPLRRSSDN